MIIDERGKLFGKISIVDIGVVLIILALLAGGFYKFFLMGNKSSNAKFDTIEYKFQIKEVRQQTINAIETGADIYDSKTGSYMGKVTNKEVSPATDFIDKADGSIVLAEKPERFDVVVTVTAPGVETAGGYLVNGNRDVNRGSKQVLQTRMIIMEAQITDVRKVK